MGNGPSSSNGKMASYLRLSSEDPFQNRNGCMQLVEDGHCRYFGATSNLHLLPSGSLLNFQPGSSKLRAQQVEVLSRANLTWNGDHSYEQHLTHLFFAWHNSFIHAIDEAVYRHHQDQYANGMATQLYSPALANAILAMGSLYSTRRCDKLPRLSGPEFFSRRAKALLDLEMDSPTIATLQALLTLSSFELSQARDSRGRIFLPMRNAGDCTIANFMSWLKVGCIQVRGCKRGLFAKLISTQEWLSSSFLIWGCSQKYNRSTEICLPTWMLQR